MSAEPGIAAGQSAPAATSAGGPVQALPAGRSLVRSARIPGEALLALPKGPGGDIPRDYELGPGASIASAFFSPVLCATIARVVGPRDAAPAALVTTVPDTAIVVPHHVYATAGVDVRPLAAPPVSAVPAEDPYRSLQYSLARADVAAARPFTNGSGVRVAVLDSAAEAAHRDLGQVTVVPLPDAKPRKPGLHGTLVAGVIAATEGNGYGIAGLAPGVELLSLDVCEPLEGQTSDACPLYALIRGVDTAFGERSDILNLSLVGPPNPLLERAMFRLEELGLLVVAAAGNEGATTPRYPAAYPPVIGVGAVDVDGQPFALTNRGDWVDVYAPGVEILSTVPGNAFAFGSGTSLSAAHVTGLLALLHAVAKDAPLSRAAFSRTRDAELADGAAVAPLALPVCRSLERMGHPCRK